MGRSEPRRAVSHYRILEKVGSGGFSVVYKAQDLNLNRLVALKFLPPHLVDSREAVARLCREARAISALNHPHIATIYELGKADGQFFLALEYLPGGTVRSMVRDLAAAGKQLPAHKFSEFAIGIAEGLCHAHRAGIIHRDVKSDNVMLAADGSVKLTDFGLAKLRGGQHVTRAGSIVGTASYMSPEQARGAEVDHRSDIFSFGVVLFEMATGRLPFQGPHEAAILSGILNDCPPRLSALRPDLPEGVQEIVSRALRKDPGQRHQHTCELLEQLRAVAASSDGVAELLRPRDETWPLLSRPPEPNADSGRRRLAHRRPWLWAAVLSAAALASAFTLGDRGPHLGADKPGIVRPAGALDLYREGRRQLQRYETVESLDRAIGLFERALELDQKFALPHAGLGEAYWRKYKLTQDRQWIQHAGDSCRRAIELGAPLAPVRITLGLIQAGTGRYSEALREFERALEVDPLNTDASREMGNAYAALGRHDDAEEAYRKAIEFRPGDWAAYNELGRLYWNRGRYPQAEAEFRKVIELTPDNVRGYNNLGGLLVLMGRYESANSVLERSLAIKPTGIAYSNLGTAYFFQQRYAESARMMEKAVESHPEDSRLWGNLADAYRHIPGRAEDSRSAYRRAIELGERQTAINPGDAPLRASLASYYAGLGIKRKAIAGVRVAQRLSPSNVNVQFRAALTYELAGLRAEALEALGVALREGYSSEEIRRHPSLQALRADPRYHDLPAKQ